VYRKHAPNVVSDWLVSFKMRIAVPTIGNGGLDEAVGEHFGRVPTYTIIDEETGSVEIIQNTSHHMGGSSYPPEILYNANVDIMLCSGLGVRAIRMFEERGIRVYIGASGTVRDAIEQWRNGMLQEATDENACRRHTFRRGKK